MELPVSPRVPPAFGIVLVVLLSGVGVLSLDRASAQPGQQEAQRRSARAIENRQANGNAARCNAQGNADVKACLVPASDVMHDPAKRVADGVDCFWRKDGTKRFEDVAGNDANGNGVRVAYRFVVANLCAAAVEVRFTLAPATPGAPVLEFEDCTGTVFSETLAGGQTERVATCTSRPYRAGAQTFSRTFAIEARAPGVGTFVPYDPEVVIEEAQTP